MNNYIVPELATKLFELQFPFWVPLATLITFVITVFSYIKNKDFNFEYSNKNYIIITTLILSIMYLFVSHYVYPDIALNQAIYIANKSLNTPLTINIFYFLFNILLEIASMFVICLICFLIYLTIR